MIDNKNTGQCRSDRVGGWSYGSHAVGHTVPGRRQRFRLIVVLVISIFLLSITSAASYAQQKKLIIVVGAAGQPEYGERFNRWVDNWEAAIGPATTEGVERESTAQISAQTIGLENAGERTDFQRLEDELAKTVDEPIEELWLVLIGHGTYDRKTAKFNLRGPDVSTLDLKQWLAPLPCRIVLINCASASGPFINQLAGPNRIVISATKSGFQYNFARFGGYLSESIGDPTIDLDKDQQTSLLEAFLAASARTQEFYVQETRLATELALLDDNGDGLGTPAEWFQGTRAFEKPKQGEADGLAANQVFLFRRGGGTQLTQRQLQKRNELEQQLEQLRIRKSELGEEVYYEMLEPIMVELAKVYAPGSQAKQ